MNTDMKLIVTIADLPQVKKIIEECGAEIKRLQGELDVLACAARDVTRSYRAWQGVDMKMFDGDAITALENCTPEEEKADDGASRKS